MKNNFLKTLLAVAIAIAVNLIFLFNGCKTETKDRQSEKPGLNNSLLGNKSPVSESLNGTWQFSKKSLLSDNEEQILGFLSMDDGQYQYTSMNKSPYRYAFILQSKGNYELQFFPGISKSTRLNHLPTDTTIANINFEIFTNPGDLVIKEFQIKYKKESSTLEFQTLLTGFQLWKLEKAI